MSDLSANSLPAGTPPDTPARRVWRRFRRHRLACVSGILLAVMSLLCIAAPFFETALDVSAFKTDLFSRFAPPDHQFLLGADEAGRDVFTRLLHGGRVSLLVGLAASVIAAVIGTSIGLAAGYRGGWMDRVLMRLTDGVIALPLLPLLIVLAAIDPAKLGLPDSFVHSEQATLYRITVIVSLVGWTTVARLVRAETLSLRERDFVRAAIAQGARPGRVMRRHILPNCAAVIVVATTLSIGNIILLESVLSFLGLGIQPPLPSWGNMLTNAQELVWSQPWLAIWPGLAIFITVIAFNFLGDGLQEALDPRAE